MTARFSHPLGLSRTEWRVLRNAHHARSLVPNGHFLAGSHNKAISNAVNSLVQRGYIRRVGRKASGMVGGNTADWPIVKVTKVTVARYNRDLASAMAPAEGETA